MFPHVHMVEALKARLCPMQVRDGGEYRSVRVHGADSKWLPGRDGGHMSLLFMIAFAMLEKAADEQLSARKDLCYSWCVKLATLHMY